jgi:DNA polymerase family B
LKFKLNRGLEPLTNPKGFRFGTWDIEASNWWTLELIGLFDGTRYVHFRTIPEFLEYLFQDSRYDDWRFFAHFGGRYDLNFVFDFLRSVDNVECEFYCSGAMVLQMVLYYKNMRVRLCDSLRLFYMPANNIEVNTDNKNGLAALTKAFGVPHQKQSYNFEEMSYGPRLIEYNEWDCRGLYEVIDRFYIETGVMSETYASHSLKVWRKDFQKETIWKPREEICDLARQTYHGGRCEVFQRHNENLYAYDINSMYPHVMRSGIPVEYVGESTKLLDQYYGFVEAEIRIPESYIPILPVRLEKLYFPCGLVRSAWTSEELISAEMAGCKITKIFKAAYFKTKDLFKDFVLKLYELKKHAQEPTRTIAKGLLNAFYGKFGQNPTKRVYCTQRRAPERSFPILYPDGTPSGFCYYERVSRNAYLLPHISSAITSKARLHLLKELNENVYYCDTDSVFTPQTMHTSKELGAWSLVGEGEATFIQPKLYKFKGKWKSKGLNREQSIDDFIAGNANTIRRAQSIKEALRSGTDATRHVTMDKYLRETRPKRAWIGENTRPWNIQELNPEERRFKL